MAVLFLWYETGAPCYFDEELDLELGEWAEAARCIKKLHDAEYFEEISNFM